MGWDELNLTTTTTTFIHSLVPSSLSCLDPSLCTKSISILLPSLLLLYDQLLFYFIFFLFPPLFPFFVSYSFVLSLLFFCLPISNHDYCVFSFRVSLLLGAITHNTVKLCHSYDTNS